MSPWATFCVWWLPVGLALLAGCSDLPPLPAVKTDGFSPIVRKQVEEAHRQALAAPKNVEKVGELGMVLHAYHNLDTAMVVYQRAALLDRGSPRWPYYMGIIAQIRNSPDAVRHFQTALRLKPDDVTIQFRLAEVLSQTGKLAESRKWFEAVLAARPRAAVAMLGLGRVLEQEGKLEEAIRYYHLACGGFPGYKQARHALAQVYRRLGDAENARLELERYEKLPDSAPSIRDDYLTQVRSYRTGPEVHLRAALQLARQNRYRMAIGELTMGLALDPEHAESHGNMIRFHNMLGNYEEALRHYQVAVKLRPLEPVVRYNHGNTLLLQGKPAEALGPLRKALELNPQLHIARTKMAEALAALGRSQEAEQEFQQVVAQRPRAERAHAGLGLLLARRGNCREAAPHLAATAGLGHKNRLETQIALGRCFSRMGEVSKAAQAWKEAEGTALAYGSPEQIREIERALGSRKVRANP